ncbi:chemotaxis protein CheW [Haloarcula halophila]|uniref:chemotaxis protein CheW n=1 Tax=Haloarcula TaxID=2237 RepID=UPI0023E468CD|nr:chemotaxis protein CheW [Halomicroarcula sp. DFY41]
MGAHQVFEFILGEEQYCIDIESVTEVVSRSEKDVTSIPDSPPHVEGAIDLRGETTRIIDPSARLLQNGHEDTGINQDRMIVFDTEMTTGGRSGWGVTEVRRILTIDPDSVEAVDEEMVNGLVAREDGHIVWIDPETISVET